MDVSDVCGRVSPTSRWWFATPKKGAAALGAVGRPVASMQQDDARVQALGAARRSGQQNSRQGVTAVSSARSYVFTEGFTVDQFLAFVEV